MYYVSVMLGIATSFLFDATTKSLSIPTAIMAWIIYTIIGTLIIYYVYKNTTPQKNPWVILALFFIMNILCSALFFGSRFN